MISALNECKIIRKDNKWNSMYPEQEKNFSLTSAANKLKNDNLKLAKNFKSAPPGDIRGKGKGKGNGKGHKKTGKQAQNGN